jgi:DNA topoisomerase-3
VAKALIITEKPSVARDLVAALGGFEGSSKQGYWESDRFLCTFAVGHLLELLAPEDIDPAYKQWSLTHLPILPQRFSLKPIREHEERLQTIRSLASRRDVERLVNACDAAREGELIFREIVAFLGVRLPIERLWLQSMTPEAIRASFARLRPGEQLRGLADAAACRAKSDWLIGMNATRAAAGRRGPGRSDAFRRPPWPCSSSVSSPSWPTTRSLTFR